MVVVSENMIAYTLNKNINGEKLLNDINKLVNEFQKNNIDNQIPILVIDIRTVTRDDNSLIPKLEYKPK